MGIYLRKCNLLNRERADEAEKNYRKSMIEGSRNRYKKKIEDGEGLRVR